MRRVVKNLSMAIPLTFAVLAGYAGSISSRLAAADSVSESRPLQRPEIEFKIFQFPADKIPRIDGDADDWSIVPAAYGIGTDQLRETVMGIGDQHDRANLDVMVKVGWVKGQNHLYFLYEASDNYWDFARDDLHNDIFEVVIDADRSGGPLIRQMHPDHRLRDELETHFQFHGVHAQNYHIFTPAEGKDWAMVWGGQAVDQGFALCERCIQV